MFRVLRKVCFQSEVIRMVFATKTFSAAQVTRVLNRRPFTSFPVVRSRPVLANIGLGGVLTFLGLARDEEEREPELILILKRSILMIEKEEFQRAEELLHIALKMAHDQQNFQGMTYAFDVMANLAYDTGDYSKAEKLFITVMQRLMAGGTDANDNKMIHVSAKLAKIYENRGDASKAEEGYKFCVENLEHKIYKEGDESDDTLLLWAYTLDHYANFLFKRDRLEEALHCYEKAYDTCVRVSGKLNEQVVILLNDRGTVTDLLGHPDCAVKLIEEAIEIGKQLPQMQYLGTIYVNLGQMYLAKKMLNECEKVCLEGKKVAAKFGDKETEAEADECLKQVKQAMSG